MATILAGMSKRRGKPVPFTAAAVRPNLGSKKSVEQELGMLARRPEQSAAWDAFDGVPEVKHAVWGMGNLMSKVRLHVAIMDREVSDVPIPVSEYYEGAIPPVVASAIAELDRLNLGDGISEILRESTMNLDVAGEFYLVGWGARDPVIDEATGAVLAPGADEEWAIASVSEVSERSGVTFVSTTPNGKGRPLDPERDTIMRVWQRHPRWSNLADSHLIGCLNDVEQLRALHLRELADNQARHTGGLFTLPNELTAVRPTSAEEAEYDDDEDDPLVEALDLTWSEPMGNPASANFGAPTILRGPAKYLTPEYLRHVRIDGTDSKALDDRVEAKVRRLARGLNMPYEYTMGHQSTTFANAGQVDRDEFSDYVEPRIEFLVNALTIAFLRPQLLDAHPNATAAERDLIDGLFVWYDPSAVLPTEDLSDKVALGLDQGLIGKPTARETLGFSEEDAPEAQGDDTALALGDVEKLAAAIQKLYLGVGVLITADEAREILRGYGAPLDGPMPEPEEEPEPVVAAAAIDRPRDDLGQQLVDIDRALRDRLLSAADAAVTRALERAGNRIRNQASLRPRLKNVAAADCAATLGRSLVADAMPIPGLIDDAFERLEGEFKTWAGAASDQAFTAVERVVGEIVGGFSPDQRATMKLRRMEDVEEAWKWTEEALRSLTEARLFDPSYAIGTIGEALEHSVVPPGLIREAMARAGGAAHLRTDGTSAFVVVGSSGPVGGVATGPHILDVVTLAGGEIEGWEWSYGAAIRTRPFPPHVELGGLVFTDFTDERLAIDGSFPETEFYTPGDHAGCLCDLIPVIIAPDGSTREDL